MPFPWMSLNVHERLKKKDLQGRTLTLKIKHGDFKQITRGRSFPLPFTDAEKISEAAKQLLAGTFAEGRRIRLRGITLSNFGEPGKDNDKSSDQFKLF